MVRQVNHVAVVIRFDRTYEELKQIQDMQRLDFVHESFDRTYEELKLHRSVDVPLAADRFDRTYEEL